MGFSIKQKRRYRKNFPFYFTSVTIIHLNMLESARSRATNIDRFRRLEDETKCLVKIDQVAMLSHSSGYTTNEVVSLLKKVNARKSLQSTLFLNILKTLTDYEKAQYFNSIYRKGATDTLSSENYVSREVVLTVTDFQDASVA